MQVKANRQFKYHIFIYNHLFPFSPMIIMVPTFQHNPRLASIASKLPRNWSLQLPTLIVNCLITKTLSRQENDRQMEQC